MSSLSLPTLVPGDQVTDALGELVLDVPHRRAWTRHVGELRLMAAVLEDALNVLRKCPRSRAGRDARGWVPSRDASCPFPLERTQLRGDAALTSRACGEAAGAAAAPLPASPPRNYRTGKIFPNCIMKARSPDT